jgi:hypothetical protein
VDREVFSVSCAVIGMIPVPTNKRMIPTAKHFLISGFLSMSFPLCTNYIALFSFKNVSLEPEAIDTVLTHCFLCESNDKKKRKESNILSNIG